MSFNDFPLLTYLSSIIDILIVWFVIYKLIMIIRGTKAIQLLKGIILIVIVKILSSVFGFNTVQWIMNQALDWGFLAIIIIFQPELRRALEQLGRGKVFKSNASTEEEDIDKVINAIIKSTEYMGKRRIGALISIERETGLNDYIETGIPLYAEITSELLINLFIPNTPLHDGAVIISKNRLMAASCYLPLSESPLISKELGTRHRAAIGISEVTDSVTVIVSEETGSISVTKNGELYRGLTENQLREILQRELVGLDGVKSTDSQPMKWNWRGRP